MSGDPYIKENEELRAEIARLQAAIEKEEKFTMAAMDKAKAYWAALEEIAEMYDPYDEGSAPTICRIARKALAKEGK